MFAHALPQGGLRPAEALPPTLTPNAIFAMAPPAPRAMGFLGACAIYAGCGLAMTLAPSLNISTSGGPKTDPNGFVVPAEPPHINVELIPARPPVPASLKGVTMKDGPKRDDTWAPPSPIDAVPPTPDKLPTENRFGETLRGGDNSTPAVVPAGSYTNEGQGPAGAAPVVVPFDFQQMRVLQRVDPIYPPLAKMAKIQGEVILLMAVDPRGVPTEVKALSGPHPSLEQEAMRIARLWRFEPASLNGQPVTAQFRLTIVFRLK